jgi:hypothetical protein
VPGGVAHASADTEVLLEEIGVMPLYLAVGNSCGGVVTFLPALDSMDESGVDLTGGVLCIVEGIIEGGVVWGGVGEGVVLKGFPVSELSAFW